MGEGPRRLSNVASKLALLLAAGTLMAGSLLTSTLPASASGIGVFVGYADSLRANPTNFPTPWVGSPKTVFEGCAPVTACTYDAGAVRIVNNTAGTLTVNAVAVHVDTCTFSGWPAATLAPGANLIVTQLATLTNLGCNAPALMDTSDVGPGGSNYASICTPDGILPTVDVTINGQTTHYTDSGQVLNTGGFDGACTGNESTQWTAIGHTPCRGSLLSLTPASQTRGIGMVATVTATFTNSCGQPLSNVAVQFSVLSGPNAGRTGSGATDASGVATFSYTSGLSGMDTLRATVSNIAGSIPSNTVTVTWIPFVLAGGGAFVIGDLENSSGAHVSWWGARWWKLDRLSSGLAPASFKGFENGSAVPMCGQTWTSRPGNSSKPPRTVPAFMAVIVSSRITKTGPVISGDIAHIVVVRTSPGYAANPGHVGTGTIVGQIC